jgi:hypothetical protein
MAAMIEKIIAGIIQPPVSTDTTKRRGLSYLTIVFREISYI